MSKKSKPGDGLFPNGVKGMSPGATENESLFRTFSNLFSGMARIWAWK